jgi:hypothetical protein
LLLQHLETRQLAGQVLRQWLLTAVAQAQVLADPRYVQDPRSVLEARWVGRGGLLLPCVCAWFVISFCEGVCWVEAGAHFRWFELSVLVLQQQ